MLSAGQQLTFSTSGRSCGHKGNYKLRNSPSTYFCPAAQSEQRYFCGFDWVAAVLLDITQLWVCLDKQATPLDKADWAETPQGYILLCYSLCIKPDSS